MHIDLNAWRRGYFLVARKINTHCALRGGVNGPLVLLGVQYGHAGGIRVYKRFTILIG